MEEKSTEFRGALVNYAVTGSATGSSPLVFIHGFCEDHTIWNEFIQPFAGRHIILLPDLPGFGRSTLPTESTDMGFYADCVKAMLDEEHIESCLMIGHSMGGYVTLNFAQRFPELLAGYCLFHSTAYADDETRKEDRRKVAEFVRSHGRSAFVNELYNQLFASAYSNSHADEIADLKERMAAASSVEGIASASLAMAGRDDTSEVLDQSRVPVLFIIGKEDRAIPPGKTLPLTTLPERSFIHMLDAAGHMGMIECVDESREILHEWITWCHRPDDRT